MKKAILNSALLLILSATVFTSCKKEVGSDALSQPQFKAKFDAAEKTFSVTAFATKNSLGTGVYSLIIMGTSNSEIVNINLWSDQDDFAAGKTYEISALGGTTENSLSYGIIASSNLSDQWFSTYLYSVVPENFKCTITEINSSFVKGTFSGTVYRNQASPVEKMVITDGQFYAKF